VELSSAWLAVVAVVRRLFLVARQQVPPMAMGADEVLQLATPMEGAVCPRLAPAVPQLALAVEEAQRHKLAVRVLASTVAPQHREAPEGREHQAVGVEMANEMLPGAVVAAATSAVVAERKAKRLPITKGLRVQAGEPARLIGTRRTGRQPIRPSP
jgi:hypothetical protein